MWSPLFLSLRIAFIATLINLILGLFLAYRSLSWRKLRTITDVLFLLPMVLPPTVLGFFLLMLFSKQHPLGAFLDTHGIQVVFTAGGGILAAILVSFPLMIRSAQSAMAQMDRNLCQAARTLGMREWDIFWKVVLPNILPGVITGVLLSFARAFGEFGATIMIAGNIPGKTQTVSMAIYSAMQSGNYTLAYQWVFIMIVFSAICILIMNFCVRKNHKKVTS